MRNFLLVFLLLNVLAFAYQSWILAPETSVDAFHIEQDYPSLNLAQTLPKVAVDPVATVVLDSGESADAPEWRCLRIGPFPREKDAQSVRASLEDRDAQVQQSSEPGQVWVGHWVQVADQGDRAAAEKSRDALVAAGISDAYVLPGDDDFRISLGVFRLRSSANRVMEQASRLGYDTRVDDRFQPGENFWLQVRMPGDRVTEPGEFQTDSGQILRTENIPCDAAASLAPEGARIYYSRPLNRAPV